jgi:Ca2+-binding EF-hand superfamily protein
MSYLPNIPDIGRVFTPDQIADFRRTFDSITAGRAVKLIRVSELGEVMRYIGFSPDEVEIQVCFSAPPNIPTPFSSFPFGELCSPLPIRLS